jgi:release factor glutamine methyltransferase
VPTVASCLAEGNQRLSTGPHSDRARMDSELLLMHVLGRNKAWLLAHGEDDVSENTFINFIDFIECRYRGEPIQHITGECEFFGLPLKVTPDVLVPRPETEHLVEKVIELAQRFGSPRIVDIGTGSGAIAVALARKLPGDAITATDLSESALNVARQNAALNGVSERVRFLQGDLLAPLAGERFQIIASNPPYVPDSDRALIAVEVREFEPALALFAGEDGLDIYRRLIPAAHAALVPGGFLVLEIGFTQAEAIERLLAAHGFNGIEFTPDLQGIPRVASAQRAIYP